jgi:hypothetical protein
LSCWFICPQEFNVTAFTRYHGEQLTRLLWAHTLASYEGYNWMNPPAGFVFFSMRRSVILKHELVYRKQRKNRRDQARRLDNVAFRVHFSRLTLTAKRTNAAAPDWGAQLQAFQTKRKREARFQPGYLGSQKEREAELMTRLNTVRTMEDIPRTAYDNSNKRMTATQNFMAHCATERPTPPVGCSHSADITLQQRLLELAEGQLATFNAVRDRYYRVRVLLGPDGHKVPQTAEEAAGLPGRKFLPGGDFYMTYMQEEQQYEEERQRCIDAGMAREEALRNAAAGNDLIQEGEDNGQVNVQEGQEEPMEEEDTQDGLQEGENGGPEDSDGEEENEPSGEDEAGDYSDSELEVEVDSEDEGAELEEVNARPPGGKKRTRSGDSGPRPVGTPPQMESSSFLNWALNYTVPVAGAARPK